MVHEWLGLGKNNVESENRISLLMFRICAWQTMYDEQTPTFYM